MKIESIAERTKSVVDRMLNRVGILGPIVEGASFLEIGVPSTELINLVLEIEQEFSIEIDDENLTPENFKSLKNLELLMQRLCT